MIKRAVATEIRAAVFGGSGGTSLRSGLAHAERLSFGDHDHRVMQETAVTGASVRDYLMPRVFGPLGIHNPQWHSCPLGHSLAESDLLLTTSELARFGRLLLDEGMWEGR